MCIITIGLIFSKGNEMSDSILDISVLLIFFNRPETLKQVFDQVRKVKPARLFLYQDGPREGISEDIIKISECRKIVDDIDWECKVCKLYQPNNVGVDPSGYIADKWAFSQTDKCIVLEDDCLPSVSFFHYCKYLLDKYEDENKIMLISGINEEGITSEVSADYFFSRTTFTWGWASWARVVNNWEGDYTFLDNQVSVNYLNNYISKYRLVNNMVAVFEAHKKTGKAHFETVLISNQYLNDGLTIVPKKNLITNIGITGNGTHFDELKFTPRGLRKLFSLKSFEIAFPMIDNDSFDDFVPYQKRTYRLNGWNHPLIKIYRQCERYFYFLCYGKFDCIKNDFKKKIKKVKEVGLG